MNVEEEGFRVHSHQGKGGLCLLRVQPPEVGIEEAKAAAKACGKGEAGGEGTGRSVESKVFFPPFLCKKQ